MIKTKYLNKYYIKQYIINNCSFQEWRHNNYNDIIKTDKIIGYLFSVKEDTFNLKTLVLNLYLIKKDFYVKDGVSDIELGNDWELFLNKVYTDNSTKHVAVFKNPPIENWLDTKDNWCKKVATEYSKQFQKPYNDILSDVYFSIAKCYTKSNVYMGNLNYVKQTIKNDILMNIRHDKHKVYGDNLVSLNTVIGVAKDGNEQTLEDVIPEPEDLSEDSLEYRNIKDIVIKLLKNDFTDREIEQLINQRSIFLPQSLYKRLVRWRERHSIKEIYHD